MPEENLTLPGLVDDPRTDEQKEKDYQHQEVASAAIPLNWNRGIEGAPVYSLRDQNGSGSCVGQGSAKGLETLRGEVISAHPIYRRRWNFPGFGMYLQDAGDIVHRILNGGTTTELLDPSQRMTEEQMNGVVNVSTPINQYLYAFADIKNIDEIAQAIETQKHCLITINGTIKEYAYSEKPIVDTSATKMDCAHCICGVYYFTDEHGEKCILIDESWGPNQIRRRVMTESYLKARGTGAMYFIPPAKPTPPVKPEFNFTVPLEFGQNNYSIKMLQDILKYEGLFPVNVASTGYYGEITRKAVLAFQRKYAVASVKELSDLNGKRVGEKTIKKLDELYK